MSKTFRNVLIGFAVAFVLSFAVNLLPLLLGISEEVDLGSAPRTLSMVAGTMTFFILSGLSGNRKVAGADKELRQRAMLGGAHEDENKP